MSTFRLAVAQISSEKGDIDANLKTHIKAAQIAAEHSASLLVFPELSLTGYEGELAQILAMTTDDERLAPLKNLAIYSDMHIVVGAPLKTDHLPEIGAIVFAPDGEISFYAKMHLHPGEDQYFQAGHIKKLLDINAQKVAMAICADTNHEEHVNAYAELGASVYVAGVLITEGGYQADTEKLSAYAKEHGLLVAMANHNQPTGGWQPIGKSAIWDRSGLLACVNETENCLVIAEKVPTGWQSKIVALSL